MNWYLGVLKNYTGFSGRAHRTEFWMFVVINMVISFILGIIDVSAGMTSPMGYGVLSTIYGLCVFVPTLAVSVRRLHDTGRSGLWCLLGFIPLIGTIVLFVVFAQEGMPGSNQYGEDPKAT